MRVVMVEPEKEAYIKEIDSDLDSMQKIVGGYIQIIYSFPEPVALICNDEGKLLGLPLNRGLRDNNGKLYNIISGTFFLFNAPADSDKLTSLTPEQETFCLKRFGVPELFLNIGGHIIVLPLEVN